MRRFVLILAVILLPLAALGAMVLADRTLAPRDRGRDYVIAIKLPPPGSQAALPKIEGPLDASRPLVVIDPGHGGKDPGAGGGAIQEKVLTLQLALALRDELLRQGGVRVALTRSDDRYLFLPERTRMARELGADLFISLHADSTEADTGASGATVYTLSARGSSEVAERMAARENAADRIGGVLIEQQDDAVGAILLDLSQREAQDKAEAFARLLLREGAGRIPFHERSYQSAAFAVLKAPDVPSVLLESGYINHPADLARLASPAGREALAVATARAVRVYFARSAAAATGG